MYTNEQMYGLIASWIDMILKKCLLRGPHGDPDETAEFFFRQKIEMVGLVRFLPVLQRVK